MSPARRYERRDGYIVIDNRPRRRRKYVDAFAYIGVFLIWALPFIYYILTGVLTNTGIADQPRAFIQGALEELNKIRISQGLPPVQLINLTTAQFRVGYIAARGVLSHYDVEGRHPVYYYTRLDGGIYGAEENIYQCSGACIVDRELGRRIVEVSVFEDADSNWGHRDSLLDPCNNYAAVAVVRNGSNIFAAVYMLAVWIQWITPPRYADGVFYAEGIAKLPPSGELSDGRRFYEIFIYRAVPTLANYHRDSYSIGDSYAGVLPPNAKEYYPKIKTIYADVYDVQNAGDGWSFKIKFKFTPPDDALYTVVMSSHPTGVDWIPMSPGGSYRLKSCEIMTYVIAKN